MLRPPQQWITPAKSCWWSRTHSFLPKLPLDQGKTVQALKNQLPEVEVWVRCQPGKIVRNSLKINNPNSCGLPLSEPSPIQWRACSSLWPDFTNKCHHSLDISSIWFCFRLIPTKVEQLLGQKEKKSRLKRVYFVLITARTRGLG